MNKLFIVFLAVCLVTVHTALVKREAETASPNYVEDIKKQLEALSKSINEDLSKVFNPEQIKKTFDEGVDNVSKLINDLGKKEDAKQ